jgi:hypothetical protein
MVNVEVILDFSAEVTMYAELAGCPSQNPHTTIPGIISVQFLANAKIRGAGNHASHPAIMIFLRSYRSASVPEIKSVKAAAKTVKA